MSVINAIVKGCLPDEDSALFYKLWMGLLDYVNRKFSVEPGLGKITSPENTDIHMLLPVRDKLWEDVSVIDEYIVKARLPADEIIILEGWKNAVCGDFILMKHLKKYSVLMTNEIIPLLYGVTGIYSKWDELIQKERLPVVINCALIPFKGRIIYDSLLRGGNVTYGSNYKKRFNEAYRGSKARYGIIESFNNIDHIISRHAADIIRRTRIRDEILVDTYDEDEEISAWHCYLTGKLPFPFEAVCEKQMIRSPLMPEEKVTVIGLAETDDYKEDIAAMIKWQDRKFAVPLVQLRPADPTADFTEAIEDWKYWVSAGHV